MFCSNCGAENADGAKFCSSCGAGLAAAPAEPVAPPQPEAPVAEVVIPEPISVPDPVPAAEPAPAPAPAPEEPIEQPAEAQPAAPKQAPLAGAKSALSGLAEKCKPLTDKVAPFISKNKLLVTGVLGGIALIICICIIASLFSGGNGYTSYEHFISATTDDGVIFVIYDNKVIDTGIEADYIRDGANSIDGNVCAFLTGEDELVVVKNKKATVVDENVEEFALSVSGNGIVYLTDDGEETCLKLYNVSKKKSAEITDEFDGYKYSISPDGKSVVYNDYDEDDESFNLMYSNGKKSTKITSAMVDLLGVSNDGKYIYAYGYNDDGDCFIYAYNKKGEKEKLGSFSNGGVRYNEDMTQILFNYDGKTYISTKGKAAEKISNNSIYPLIAPNTTTMTVSGGVAYPVDDLYGLTYTGYDSNGNRSVWYIHKNSDKSCKLVSDVSSTKLDESAEYLYYLNDDYELCVLKISHKDDASDKAKVLAEDVATYMVTSDRSKAYYISDGCLYSCNGKNGNSKKTVTSDEVDNTMAMTSKDVLFYNIDGDVYATSNGKRGKKVASDIESLIDAPNGYVYAATDDGVYVSSGSKTLKKIWEND